jgi:hypothetical protein
MKSYPTRRSRQVQLWEAELNPSEALPPRFVLIGSGYPANSEPRSDRKCCYPTIELYIGGSEDKNGIRARETREDIRRGRVFPIAMCIAAKIFEVLPQDSESVQS